MSNFFSNLFANNKIDKPKSYRYNQYYKKNGNEDMFVCQKYLSNPDFTTDDPYQASIIAIFRNIKPKKGMSSITFEKNPVILYDRKEIDRHLPIIQKRQFD